jgi:hypothetical protein
MAGEVGERIVTTARRSEELRLKWLVLLKNPLVFIGINRHTLIARAVGLLNNALLHEN